MRNSDKYAKIRSFLSESKIFYISWISTQLAKLLPYFFAARFFGPETAGFWSLLFIVLNFSKLGQLGVTNAMNRELPILLGAGNDEAGRKISDTAFIWNWITSVLVSLLMVVAGALFVKDSTYKDLCFFAAALSFCVSMQQYYEMLAKCHKLLRVLSQSQWLYTLVVFVLSPMCLLIKNPYFLIISLLSAHVICLIRLYFGLSRLVSPKTRFSYDVLKRLLVVGIPLTGMIAGAIFLTGFDKFVVAGYMSKADLGFYSLSIFTTNGLLLIPYAITQMTYVKLGYAYGSNNHSDGMVNTVLKDMRLPLIINICAVLVVYSFGDKILMITFPQLYGGLGVLKILVVGAFLITPMPGFSNMLMVLGGQWAYFITQIVGITITVIMFYLAVHFKTGINGVAYATVAGTSVQAVLIVIFTVIRSQKLSLKNLSVNNCTPR